MITREDVQKLAELSLLAVADEELDKITGEIDAILGYVSELSKLQGEANTGPVVPELHNVMRDDGEPHPSGQYTEALVREMPRTEGQYLQVKKIL